MTHTNDEGEEQLKSHWAQVVVAVLVLVVMVVWLLVVRTLVRWLGAEQITRGNMGLSDLRHHLRWSQTTL